MKRIVAVLAVLVFVASSISLFAKGNGSGMKIGSGKGMGGYNKSYSGESTQNGFKTGDRALDGTGKGYGDGTKPQPKDGTGFGATAK
ncbi:hypothetical protein [Calditerrivibrio sp.]|uniref:hypothetical protein n=1 Tax=Calditerrivibrio sp. TaxID=2792612 RepID=UPI003D0D2669